MPGHRGHQQVHAKHGGRERLGVNQPEIRRAGDRDVVVVDELLRTDRAAGKLPALGKTAFAVRGGGTADLHGGVAPRVLMLLRTSLPHASDAESADVGDAPVRAQVLAMVPRRPSECGGQAWRIEHAHLTAGSDERGEEAEQGTPATAEPVVDDPHLDARAGSLGKQLDKPAADRIPVDDVHLEMNRGRRGTDRLFPGRVVLSGIPQHAHVVAADQRRAGRPAEDLVGAFA